MRCSNIYFKLLDLKIQIFYFFQMISVLTWSSKIYIFEDILRSFSGLNIDFNISNFEIQIFLWIFRTTSNVEMVYTKIAAINIFYNFIVKHIFIWCYLEVQILVLNFKVLGSKIWNPKSTIVFQASTDTDLSQLLGNFKMAPT